MKFQQERKQDDQAYSGTGDGLGSGPSYNRESKKKRDMEALQKVEQRASN